MFKNGIIHELENQNIEIKKTDNSNYISVTASGTYNDHDLSLEFTILDQKKLMENENILLYDGKIISTGPFIDNNVADLYPDVSYKITKLYGSKYVIRINYTAQIIKYKISSTHKGIIEVDIDFDNF